MADDSVRWYALGAVFFLEIWRGDLPIEIRGPFHSWQELSAARFAAAGEDVTVKRNPLPAKNSP
jgi:hypothetical protein